MRKSAEIKAEQNPIKTRNAKSQSAKSARIQAAEKKSNQTVSDSAIPNCAQGAKRQQQIQPASKTVRRAAEHVSVQNNEDRAVDGYVEDGLESTVGALFRAIADVDDRQIVIVCFGTNAISGDSLGPAVGSLLRDKYRVPAFVYGTDNHPVNGKNMGEWIEFIKAVHGDALYIAVDASLGAGEKTGQIILRGDGVCPAAIKGKKERFGDVGILGVVAKNSSDPLMQLMSVSPVYVGNMAEKIANLLNSALA